MESIIVLTRKNLHTFIEDGGVGWWRLNKERAEQCTYVICTHNFPKDSERHRTAFFIGKIKNITSTDHPDQTGLYRRCINISEYAYINSPPIRFNTNENPVNYTQQQDLEGAIDFSSLDWQPFPESSKDDLNPFKDSEEIQNDLNNINNNQAIPETERKALVAARLGQGAFRKALLDMWEHKCPITGCNIPKVLRASHILAWSDPQSTNKTRLDPANGLLLAASIDALFDKYLISFTDDGHILFSYGIEQQSTALGICHTYIGPLTEAQKKYMAIHREKFYRRS